MVLICGVDEAGRGPVIGDMVIAGCLIEESDERINGIGADSKKLTREKREELYPKLKNVIKDFEIVRISAMEIDMKNKVGCNLNTLEFMKMADVINKLNPDKVLIDCPHPIPEKFVKEIMEFIKNKNIEIIAEHRADDKYPLVGAASILAKVTRDNHITQLEQELGLKLGSGYPSDPNTKKALEQHIDNPKLEPYLRHCWDTYKNAKNKKEQKSLNSF